MTNEPSTGNLQRLLVLQKPSHTLMHLPHTLGAVYVNGAGPGCRQNRFYTCWNEGAPDALGI